MATFKLIGKLFKRNDKNNDKNNVEASNNPAATSSSPSHLPMMATILEALLPQTASRLLSPPGKSATRSMPSPSTLRSPLSIFTAHQKQSFSLFGLLTANAFFEMIGDGMSDLRFVTIRSKSDWRSESEEMAVEKAALLDHLELATSLRSLHLIVGDLPFTFQNEAELKSAASVGAQFLYTIRSVADHERSGTEEERVMRERFLTLCNQIGALQAVRFLKEKLKKEHEERADKVFRVGKVVSLEGHVGSVPLPLRMPEYLRKIEEDPRRTCYDGS
ncbi:hypothetical protein E8E12_003554 [Didymella heteroderae]|uniref:Uncharacterized protein n=1 Tax=Didymella heteroderae TaxID=1769908 RepID=A0A9P5C3D5_9PLEO|nr:hypothetical protein E8E12_003554 [Didymella heteroderae]